MEDKKGSIIPPKATVIAINIRSYLQAIRENGPVPYGKSINWTQNASEGGELYVPHPMLKLKSKKIKIPPPKCKLFDSPEWKTLVNSPDEQNVRTYLRSKKIGSVRNQLSEKIHASKTAMKLHYYYPSGKTYYPPFALDTDNVFNCVGDYDYAK
jgi:hypothetical protein